MKLTTFLQKNIVWNFHKNCFCNLCCQPTTEEQFLTQLQKIADRCYPQRRRVETAFTEFCMNEIALFAPKTTAQKQAKQVFDGYWQTYLRAKDVFGKKYMTFPANGKQTRLEQIAQLVAQCTQFAVDAKTLNALCAKICDTLDLDEREKRNLPQAISLYKVNHYCAVVKSLRKNSTFAEKRLAKMLDGQLLQMPYTQNDSLRQAYFGTTEISAAVDSFSNSAVKLHAPTFIETKPYFYANGKNVFDTFCFSKFGKHTAEFVSKSPTLKVKMQYFLQNNCEVRKFTVNNLGKGTKNVVSDFLFRNVGTSSAESYFQTNGALCMAVNGQNAFYAALAVVCDNKIVPCPFEEGRLSVHLPLASGAAALFDVVTVYADNMPALAATLEKLNVFGATRCPYVADCPSQNVTDCNVPTNLHTSFGAGKRIQPQKQSATLNFTYQLGHDVATFLDNAGNCTTLLQGFPFGVAGEKVYAVRCGALSHLNTQDFTLESQTVLYRKPNGTTCKILHGCGKKYEIDYPTPQKTLFLFPFEEQCNVTLQQNVFHVCGKLRSFSVTCCGNVESFTTNALECNTTRLRYKLSDNLDCGTCLAICFGQATSCSVEISAQTHLPPACPLVKESLVSTYLNYINEKNAFCLHNRLKRAESLTLAAINFTNPQFVKNYVENFSDDVFYYDVAGTRKNFCDKLALPLAIVYYLSLPNGDNFVTDQMKQYVKGVLFGEKFQGRDVCIQALALKKAAHITGFDKVQCLIEYNKLKRQICADNKLYGYAQAIGAVPLVNPSKQRLKDLCNKFEIAKSWYYVSQLENLYGLTIFEGNLHFAPKVTQENVLEQLALNVCGKRIDTVFAKSTVQSMTLNGTQSFLPFNLQNLKNDTNTLLVNY